MTQKRDPWIKFYFADFRAEPRLKMCSRAARSLWLDMLGIMHEARPYGFLLVEGIAPNDQQLATLFGDPEKQVKQWLAELKAAGVMSVVGQAMPDDVRDLIPVDVPDGAMLSRRMVRDAAKRERDRINGKGGGNPNLVGQDNPGVNPHDNPLDADGVKPKGRKGLRPRSQKPETRLPPSPPGDGDIPPPAPHACWDGMRTRAIGIFGQQFCDLWLFPCAVVPLSDDCLALEAPSRVIRSRVATEGQRLQDLLGKSVKFQLAEGVAA